MKTFNVGIIDKDQEYTGALMDYANARKKLGLRLLGFSGTRAIKDYISVENLDLISTDDLQGFSEKDDGYEYMGIKTVLFSEYGYESENDGAYEGKVTYIYKYQSAEKICKQMRDMLRVEKKDKRQVISCKAVYSPLGRCGKTTLAKALAASDEVRGGLYVAMEDFGTEVSNLGNDLLYLIKTRSTRIEEELVQHITVENGLHVLHLSGTYIDSHDVTAADIDVIRTSLLQLGRFTTIVFDIGTAAVSDISILECFDRLYVPVLRDEVSKAKFEVFLKLLKDMDKRQIITGMTTVDVPDVDYDSSEMVKKLWEIKRDDGGD